LNPSLFATFLEFGLGDFSILVGIDHFKVDDEWRRLIGHKSIALSFSDFPSGSALGIV
jgi:hypothetical protein